MQLLRILIPTFRNLRDLDIAFATHLQPTASATDAPPKPIRSHALIGQNGTGKSNLIEALLTIFRDVDLDREAAFDYTLEYSIRGHVVRIEAVTARQKRPFVWVDDKAESQGYLLSNRELLPAHIFAYYSGRNERIEALFHEHQRRFNQRQEITTAEVLSDTYEAPDRMIELEEALRKFSGKEQNNLSEAERNELNGIQDELKPFNEQRAQFFAKAENRHRGRLKHLGDDRLRRLFYCRGGHSQLVLLACLLSDDPVFQMMLKKLHIESLESALFVLKEPYRLREKRRSGKFDEQELNEGDPRFWYARGNVVSEFLDKLWQVAWAPIEQETTKQIDFRGRTERQKQLYLFVPSQERLNILGEMIGSPDSFFRYAEGAYIGDLIEEVRITVKKRDEHGGKVSFTHLSEGELQMLTVLGLMRITRGDQCLFLLDEPDTHLNPIWKLRYFDDIEGVMSSDAAALVRSESQIIITTHDPMMVGSLKREQVYIMRRDGNRTLVDTPDEHPQGMGVTGLLKSDLFGLSSTLDIETERRLFRRNELFVLSPRSLEEDEELSRLSAELADLGFSTADFRDPDYAMFVRKMAQHRRFRKPELTPEEQAEQDAIADSIIDEILREEGDQ
ncbi:AAA family ATPase [Yersinia enterocolitica]|uniref:AAA family ATPase n=1 Tax=Yersinia enterocolitica TaxID=630 RepID=UPI0021E73B24|nr:AAA family ATPase [Yersinia enterocolitica]UYK09840.1 AAA family ATPase [Yersinia enterocolitica]HDL7971672.1 AAA family ATPase [Yersinia enterocolitica]